jgi:predicted TIM-barrel enzyme
MSMTLDHTFTRAEILDRLHASINAGRPIIGAGCSAGIVAKAAERGGADFIVVYSTGRSRIMGLPTTQIGHSNTVTLEMFDEIENVVDHTPIIVGIEAQDPTCLSLPRLIERFRNKGFSGLINFPGLGPQLTTRGAMREDVGLGFSREPEMIRLAREQDWFTTAYAYNVEAARRIAAAGVDVQIAHAGWTTGGFSGRSREGAPSLDEAAEHVQAIIDVTKQENPDCICLAHGGPYDVPENVEALYRQTDAVGFVGASSIERIPIELAVRDAVASFKSATMPRLKTGARA